MCGNTSQYFGRARSRFSQWRYAYLRVSENESRYFLSVRSRFSQQEYVVYSQMFENESKCFSTARSRFSQRECTYKTKFKSDVNMIAFWRQEKKKWVVSRILTSCQPIQSHRKTNHIQNSTVRIRDTTYRVKSEKLAHRCGHNTFNNDQS